MSLRINGYSERGMVNAICSDLSHSSDLEALTTLLSWCRFPFQPHGSPDFSDIRVADIFVEQSFSDFGDLDLLFLLDHGNRKQAVLIEAKVATDTPSPKRLSDQWWDFLAFLSGNKKKTSSLFVQVYRKLRLIERVANLNQPFDLHPIWGPLDLGQNRTVLKAAQLLADYRANPWYVIVVPDDIPSVEAFFANTVATFRHDPHQLPGWDHSRVGYLSWPNLHGKFQSDSSHWQHTLSAFAWNEHQIYQKIAPAIHEWRFGSFALWSNQKVVVVGTGEKSHRVVLIANEGECFPKSLLAPVGELCPYTPQHGEVAPAKPLQGITYEWNPPTTERIQPRNRAPVPTPPQVVKVHESGWETTRVVRVDTNGSERGNEFFVFTHHLKKN
jgi:hypothetical protein